MGWALEDLLCPPLVETGREEPESDSGPGWEESRGKEKAEALRSAAGQASQTEA